MTTSVGTEPASVPPLAGPATAFLAAVVLATTAAALPALLALGTDGGDLATFGLLAGAAAVAQMLLVETGKNYGFPIAVAFVVAGVLLLPVGLVALLGIAMHAPDLVLRRYPWYIRSFNTGNYTLDALAAWAAARAISDLAAPTGTRWAVAALVACVVFIGLNHALLAVMLLLARGHGVRESGLFAPGALSIDLALAATGVAIAALAAHNEVLVLAPVASLALAHMLVRLMATANGTAVTRR